MDEQTIKTFRRKRMGWLSPEVVLHPCDLWSHFKVLEDLGLYQKEFQTINQWIEEDAEAKENFLSQFDEGDHVEWHVYECNHDDERIPHLKKTIADMAYKDGWIRMGLTEKRDRLEAEGTSATLMKRNKDIRFIADCLNATYHLHIVKMDVIPD